MSYNSWSGRGLISVSINSKMGFINYRGEIVVPVEYDEVGHFRNRVTTIKKEGLYGIIDDDGDFLLPVRYRTIEGDYHRKDLFAVNQDGKYGFFDSNYQLVIPYKYDYVSGFSEKEGLCAVGVNGKYGFINKCGEEIIPLIYDFADSFYNGLAAVVLGNKLGFVNAQGTIVVPIQYKYNILTYQNELYNDIISYGEGQRVGDGYDCSFKYSPYIAFVPSSYDRYESNRKYALINNSGQLITSYKYDRIISADSSGFTVEYEGKKVFLDITGNEYDSMEERSQIAAFRLAVEGYPEGQYEYAMKPRTSSEERHSLLRKSADQGYFNAVREIAIEYDRNEDYLNAYEWYVKAFELGDYAAPRLLGLLCCNMDNGIEDSSKKAIEWFQRYVCTDRSWSNYRIGVIFYHGGDGVKKSYEKALDFLSKSHEPDACYMCGWMYEYGQGVEVDYLKAIDYYWKSRGFKDSNERIKRLRSSL